MLFRSIVAADVADTDSAQKLDSFRDRVDDVALFFVVLVEEKMELIKSRSGHLPVGFLVKIPKRHGVGQQLIELFSHFQPYRFHQLQRHLTGHCAKCLEFAGRLVEAGLG